MREIEWIFSGLGIAIVTALIAIIKNLKSEKRKRVSEAVGEYSRIYKRNGHRLECLIPSGIHTLKNDKEIELYFTKVMEIEPHHPLRSWKSDIEKIGFKKFFQHVFKSGKSLGKENIDVFIKELKSM